MLRTVMIEGGIVHSGGKVIPWNLVFDVLEQVTDSKTLDRLRLTLKDRLKYLQMVDPPVDTLTEMAYVLGVRPGKNLKKRIDNRIKKLNDQIELLHISRRL